MMKIAFIPFLLINLLNIHAFAQKTISERVDSLAGHFLKKSHAALVIGLYDNEKQLIRYYGETEIGNGKLPDNKSIFELGEITETFTSILYSDLSIKGIVKADDQLRQYIPINIPMPVYQHIICVPSDNAHHNPFTGEQQDGNNFTRYVCFPDPSFKPQQIILCDLATHTTGLPKYPKNLKLKKHKYNPYANYSKEDLYSFIAGYEFDKPLGYDYRYSPTGIALLGHALALKMNMDFDTLLMERIFTPQQMHDTRINLSKEQKSRLLTGHNAKGNNVPHWTYNIMAPSGGLHSTADDMMMFLSLNLSKQKTSFIDVLDYTHNARVKLTDKKNKGTEIALGWKINSLNNEQRIVWQSGKTGGFSSYIGFVETNHTGIIILSSVSKDTREMAEQILRMLASEKLP